jgi:hypothetical protein
MPGMIAVSLFRCMPQRTHISAGTDHCIGYSSLTSPLNSNSIADGNINNWSTATHSCGAVCQGGSKPHFLRVFFFPPLRQQRTPQVELPMPSTVSITSNRMMSEHYFDPRGIFGCADGPSPHNLLSGVFVSCALSTPGQSRNSKGLNQPSVRWAKA